LNIFNAEKSVGGDVKKSIPSSLFNRIIFHLAIRCRTFQEISVQSLKLKFRTVAEKTAKNVRGLLYFAAPGRSGVHSCVAFAAFIAFFASVALDGSYALVVTDLLFLVFHCHFESGKRIR